MHTPEFAELESGEWEKPIQRGYLLGCCDCGLVHRFDFRVRDGMVEFKVRHAKTATQTQRRRIAYRYRFVFPQKRSRG